MPVDFKYSVWSRPGAHHFAHACRIVQAAYSPRPSEPTAQLSYECDKDRDARECIRVRQGPGRTAVYICVTRALRPEMMRTTQAPGNAAGA